MRARALPTRTIAATAAILLVAQACGDAPTDPSRDAWSAGFAVSPADFTAACSPITGRALIADNGGVTAGVVRVGNDESDVLVTIEVQDGWVMTKSQLFVGASAADIPANRNGNPTPGRFPYTRNHGPGVTSWTYAVPLSALNGADEAVIAVHADLRRGDRAEGAWGEGEMIGESGNWGMYFTHGIADCVSVLATPDAETTIVFGGLKLVIPPGAVSQDVQITVAPKDVEDLVLPASAAAAVSAANVVLGNVIAIAGTAWDLGPDGLTFDIPATITLTYDEANLPAGVAEEILQVFAVNGIFFGLESTVDTGANTVSALLEHFSTYFIGAPIGTIDLRLAGFGFSPATKLAGFPVTVHATAESDASSTDPVDATLRLDFDHNVGFVLADLPAGCVPIDALPEVQVRIECALGELDPGEQVMRNIVVFPRDVGLHNVTGTVLPVAGDETPNDNDQHGSFIAVAPVVDLRANLVAPTVVDPGELMLYQIGVINEADATNALPSGTVLLEVSGDVAVLVLDDACAEEGAPPALVVRCSVPELAPGASDIFLVTLQAGSPGQVIAATATSGVPTYVIDSNGDNDVESVETRVRADLEADLSATFTALTGPVAKAGLDYGYFVSVASAAASPDEVTGATLSLLIEGSVIPQTPPAGCSVSSTTVPATTTFTCTLAAISPGETLPTLLLIVRANTVEIGNTLEATATVAMPAGGNDPNPDNDTDTHTTSVEAPLVDMYIAQFIESADPIDLGQTVTYTIQAGNRVTATDAAPDGSRVDLRIETGNFDVVSIPAGCTDFSGAVVDAVHVGCETGLLDIGEVSATFDIVIEPLDAGPFVVLAEARPRNGSVDENPADDTETHTTTVNDAAPEPVGTLVFGSNRDSGSDAQLFTKDLATGLVTRINTTVNYLDPEWSPDGTRIAAFWGARLHVMDADGSNVVEYHVLDLFDIAGAGAPTWSADGTRIAFHGVFDFDAQQDRDLWILDLATVQVTRITNNTVNDEYPDWSADGLRIAYTVNGQDLITIDPDGSNPVTVLASTSVRHPDWSPNGARIAYTRTLAVGSAIEVVEVANPNVLTTVAHDDETNLKPAWSPDGVFIAFARAQADDDEAFDLYYALSDGTGAAQVLEAVINTTTLDVDWK